MDICSSTPLNNTPVSYAIPKASTVEVNYFLADKSHRGIFSLSGGANHPTVQVLFSVHRN